MRIGLDARLAGRGLGIAQVITGLAEALLELGVEIVWFGDSHLAPSRVSEAVPPPGPGFPGLDAPRGKRLAVEHRVELMHFAANSGWWSRGPVPHLVTVHDVIWAETGLRGHRPTQLIGHRYLRAAVPRAIRAASVVTAPSQTVARIVCGRYGVQPQVIHNGVADRWRMARPLEADKRYLVAFAGRDPRKGTEHVLAAFQRLAPRGLGLVLLTGGGIPPGLNHRLNALRETGQIDVLAYEPEHTLPEIVASAVALLYPSRDEGFGLPVAEAMAAGVPVIAGLAPVTVEVGGDAILRLDPKDPSGSAAAHVEQLLDQPGLRDMVAGRGRARAAQFTWNAAAARYRSAYESALAGEP